MNGRQTAGVFRKVLLTSDFICSQWGIAMEGTVAYRAYVIRLCLLETCEWLWCSHSLLVEVIFIDRMYIEFCLFCVDGNNVVQYYASVL
jgi:hypothetical protein